MQHAGSMTAACLSRRCYRAHDARAKVCVLLCLSFDSYDPQDADAPIIWSYHLLTKILKVFFGGCMDGKATWAHLTSF